MNEVIIDGKAYPLNLTMGGLLMYAKKKGLVVNMIDDIDFQKFTVDDYVLLLYCFLRASALAAKVEFDFTEQQIEDAIYADDSLVQNLLGLFATQEQKK